MEPRQAALCHCLEIMHCSPSTKIGKKYIKKVNEVLKQEYPDFDSYFNSPNGWPPNWRQAVRKPEVAKVIRELGLPIFAPLC